MKEKGKKVGKSSSRDVVATRGVVGSYKRGTPIVFDGDSTTTDRLSTPSPLLATKRKEVHDSELACLFKADKEDAMIDFKSLERDFPSCKSEITRPPPPPYLLKGRGGS